MNIKWKDGAGNILNANKECIKYFSASDNIKTILNKEDVKKIKIEDGLMHIFKDFEHDLVTTIVIPKKNKRDAVKIFNKYDKTGVSLKRMSSNFLLDLILESSVILGNPFLGISLFLLIGSVLFLLLIYALGFIFGDFSVVIVRILVFGYIIYSVGSYAYIKINRKRIMEKDDR